MVLLVKIIRSQSRYSMVPHQVLLKAMCWTLLLASTQATGLLDVVGHEFVPKYRGCMISKRIMDIYRCSFLYIALLSSDEADVDARNDQTGCEVVNTPQKIIHRLYTCYSYFFATKQLRKTTVWVPYTTSSDPTTSCKTIRKRGC